MLIETKYVETIQTLNIKQRNKQSMDNIISIQMASRDQIKQRLRLSVNTKCNLNCFYCHNEGQGNKSTQNTVMTINEIKKIVEIAVRSGINSIKITGGEPLLYKNGRDDIIDLVYEITSLKKFGLDFSLSMITNGILLDQYALQLKQAGLDRINISLPTLRNETFYEFICNNKSITIDKIILGISEAIKVNLKPVKINTVLFHSSLTEKGNISEIPNIFNTCKDLDVDELRLYTLLWHPNFNNFHEFYEYWGEKIFAIIKMIDFNMPEKYKSCIVSSLNKFADEGFRDVDPIFRMIITIQNLPVAFETMKFGRFSENSTCQFCKYVKNCQEGSYALRISSDGRIRGCLLKEKSINFLEKIYSDDNDENLIDLFRSSYNLLPGS